MIDTTTIIRRYVIEMSEGEYFVDFTRYAPSSEDNRCLTITDPLQALQFDDLEALLKWIKLGDIEYKAIKAFDFTIKEVW